MSTIKDPPPALSRQSGLPTVEITIFVGDLNLFTLRVMVVDEHHTLVTGNKAQNLTELTQEL